jgi:dipeptidyl-peptidase 4
MTFARLFILLVIVSVSAQAQYDPSLLSIDRLYSGEFNLQRVPPIQWLDGGNSYTVLERNGPGENIVKYATATQQKEVLVEASELIPEGSQVPLEIEDYTFSENLDKVIIFTNTKRVWRSNTKGDYWLYNLSTGKLRQIGANRPAQSLMFTKFSPDEQSVAYVSEFNLYLEQLNTGTVFQLTSDGTEDIINGTFDWAYEEEFGCRDGFRWSPDGSRLAYWQVDASEVSDFYMINTTDSVYAQIIPVQYPKVGRDPSPARIGVVDINNGNTTWINIPRMPAIDGKEQHYLPRVQWIGNKLLVRQLNRKQNTLRLWICDPETGKATKLYEEKNNSWIDVDVRDAARSSRGAMADYLTLNNEKSILLISEKEGWRNLYEFPLNGKPETLITPGDYDVCQYYSVAGNQVYINASPDDPSRRYLYTINVKGKGKMKRLTPEEYTGFNNYNISPNGKFAIHTYSTLHQAPVTSLISLPDHKMITVIAGNKTFRDKLKALRQPETEFFSVTTADNVEMHGWVMKPLDFDPSKKYPVLFYVYTEPASQTSVDRFGSRNLWHLMMAQMGYVVVTLDNRGTPSPKGTEWRKTIYRNIGQLNIHDQAMAAKEVLKWEYTDTDRVAVWGWSGGGSATLNLLFQYPEIYQTGVSIAALTNLLTYDNIYEERYMGLPQENLDDYTQGSPITHAENLEGNLLYIHGTGDDNVHYQNGEMLIDELIRLNKQFTFMSYPNRSHGIYEGRNPRRHLFTLITNYLLENCGPGPRENPGR